MGSVRSGPVAATADRGGRRRLAAAGAGRHPGPPAAGYRTPDEAAVLRLQRLAGNAGVGRLLAARPPPPQPLTVQRASPGVTGVTVPSPELGVGKNLTARASVVPGTPASSLVWALVGAPAGVTIAPAGRRAVIRSAASVPGAPVGGSSFSVQVGLAGAAPIISGPVMLVEVTVAAFTPAPAFGGPFATAIGSATAPILSADPNRDGVTGNTASTAVTTLPGGRPVSVAVRGKPGAAVAGTTITPRSGTGNQRVRISDTATGTFLDANLVINSVPTRVSGFGAQTPGMPAFYGGWNTVQFGASDPSGAGSRPVAEIITVVRDDFGFGTPTGGAGAPSLAFSAPANNWTDQNSTPTTIDVNAFEGPGVPQLPRRIHYRQQFFWMSWTGTFATRALATGKHERALMRSGTGHIFRTEQIFPAASAPRIDDAYAGPLLIVLSGVTATPTLPGATALAADGVSTATVVVATTVPGRTVDWSLVSGAASLAITAGAAANPVGAAAVVRAGTTPGRARLRVADTTFGNRRAEGVVRVVAVALRGMAAAPATVAPGATTTVVTVTAAPGGRVVDFSLDAAAAAAGVTLGAPTPGTGSAVSVVVTRPAGFTGRATVTAADHFLPARTARTRIRFR